MIPPAGQFMFTHCGRLATEDDEAAVRGLIHSGDEMQQRAFAGAGGTHQGDKFSAPHDQLNTVKRGDNSLSAAEFFGEVQGFDKRYLPRGGLAFGSAPGAGVYAIAILKLVGRAYDQVFAAKKALGDLDIAGGGS